jgi:SH3-like domain-containing protein
VESFDSPNTHIHFDALMIRDFEVSVVCDVRALTLNVRSGPGKDYASSHFLSQGDTVEPVGRTADNEWVKINLAGSEDQGWIFNSSEFISCLPDIDLLPVIEP